VILSTALSRSQREIANGVPFSDSEIKFLKVGGVTGDRTSRKIRPTKAFQRATASFMAVCRFHGTGEIVNPVPENII
jgi:hypothetical protein